MDYNETFLKACKAEYDYCKTDIVYWINNYCPIEDKDAPEVIVPMSLWEAQEQLVKDYITHRLNITLKARQLGITWLALYVCMHELIFNQGHTVIALSRTDTEAQELVRRAKVILAYQPAILQGGGITYDGNTQELRIRQGEGVSVFQSFPSSENSGRSFTANIVLLDEWAFQQWAREIWTAIYPTVNRPTGGRVIGLSTIKKGTLFEELYTSDNNFHKTFLGVFTDPRRTQEWYEATAKDMGALVKQEYPRTAKEALENIGGRFYPEFAEAVHVIPPFSIPEWWQRYVSIDYGLDKLAAGFFVQDGNGHHYQIAEIHKSGLVVSDAAGEINRIKQQLGWDAGIYVTHLAPKDLWNRNVQTGRSAADMFADHGIYLTEVSNDFENGCLAVKELIKPYADKDGKVTAKLLTFNTCPVTIRYTIDVLTDEKKPNRYAVEPHELSHINDMRRYYCVAWTQGGKEPKKESKSLIDSFNIKTQTGRDTLWR
jgi:hypothetical protein